MTIADALKDPEMVADILCDLVQETMWRAEAISDAPYHIPFSCQCCPAEKWCGFKQVGFKKWIQKEVEE